MTDRRLALALLALFVSLPIAALVGAIAYGPVGLLYGFLVPICVVGVALFAYLLLTLGEIVRHGA
jgi:hypothetical protein